MKKNRKRVWTLLVIFAMIVTMAVPAFAATDANTYTSDAKKLATPATAGDDGYYTVSVAYEDGYTSTDDTEIVGQPKEGTGTIIIDLPEGEGAKGQTFTYKIYRVFDAAVSSDGTASYSPVNGATTVPSDTFTGTHTSDTGDLTYTYKFALENGNVKLKYYDSDNSTWLDVDSAHQPNKDSAAFNEALGGVIKNYIDTFSSTDPNPIPSLMEISVTDTNGDNDRLEITNLPLGYYYITTGAGTMVTINTTNTTATVIDKNTIEKPDKEITSVTNGDDDTDRSDYSIYTDGDGHSHIGNAQIGDTVGFTGTVNIGQGAINYTYKDLMSNGLTLVKTGAGTTDDPYVPTVTVTFKRKTGTDDSGNPVYQTGTIPVNGAATDSTGTAIDGWVTPDNSADNYTVAYQGNYSGTDPEPAAGSTTFTVAFDNALLENFSADDEIYVNYSAVLNANAKVGSEGNPNEAWLSYGNDPDGGHDTETTTTTTYTGKVTVTKTDGANPAHYIEGASFVLQNKTAADGSKYTGASGQTTTDETNKYYKWDEVNGKVVWVDTEDDATVFTSKLLWQDSAGNIYYEQGDASLGRTPVYATDSEGNVLTDSEGNSIQKGVVVATVQDAEGNDVIIDSFKGLPVGHFLLHETVTPAGYNTAADVELEIKQVDENTSTTGTEDDPENTWDNTIELSTTVQNLKGFNFPSTGGIGTKILYAAGAALIAAAIIIIAVRKRKQADK
ncbi:MAG: LPXTG cell wall anchor domain-containing protein [Eubacterium sp.]